MGLKCKSVANPPQGLLAQLVERLVEAQKVLSSNLRETTTLTICQSGAVGEARRTVNPFPWVSRFDSYLWYQMCVVGRVVRRPPAKRFTAVRVRYGAPICAYGEMVNAGVSRAPT